MIRAYHDPALLHPISRDGTWNRAVEFVCARSGSRSKAIYLHNPTSATVLLKLQASAPGFAVTMPESVNVAPGVTRLEVSVTAGALPLPAVVDFVITGTVAADDPGYGAFTESAFSNDAYTMEPGTLGGTLLKAEASAFALPVGDERFGDLNDSPLATVDKFTDYIASGMGFVDDDYRSVVVGMLAEHLRDWSVWALNKHYMFDANYGPMRHARARADSIGYNPPGVSGLHPALRRRVYASAYEIARKVGSADGIRAVFQALGIPQIQLDVWREGFTWYVRVPQWVANVYGTDFLGVLALYHVDPYCTVNLAVNEGTFEWDFTDIDYTVEPGHAVQPPPIGMGGHLLLEGGTAYLLLGGGARIELQGSAVTVV